MRKSLERFILVPDDSIPKESVDVIVGIGAGLFRAYRSYIGLSLQSEKVLSLVIKLFEQKKGKKVFFSGGYNYEGRYESLTMYNQFLNYLGGKSIFYLATETRSRDSLGNATETLKWMEENHCKSAIVVDFAGHLKQMKRIFLRQSKETDIILYFVNARAIYGGNTQKRLNNFYSFFAWELLTNIYYKIIGAM